MWWICITSYAHMHTHHHAHAAGTHRSLALCSPSRAQEMTQLKSVDMVTRIVRTDEPSDTTKVDFFFLIKGPRSKKQGAFTVNE